MIYAVSDIHGCYTDFLELLKRLNFNDRDTLYILGDIIDRGPGSIELLRYISLCPNIIPLFGNHDYAAYILLPKLIHTLDDETLKELDNPVWINILSLWLSDGGLETVNKFKKLSSDDQQFYLDFMGEFDVIIEITVNGRDYILTHSLPSDFHENPTFKGRNVLDIINGRPDFSAKWKMGKTYVIGHTPTSLIYPDHRKEIYIKDDLINIDCGCVFGGNLAAFCLDTGEVIYSAHKTEFS